MYIQYNRAQAAYDIRYWPRPSMNFDTIWLNARIATLDPSREGLGIIEDGAVAARNGEIAFCGPRSELPTNCDATERVDLDGRWITPGLIDCHTHIVHGGNRAHEFELRLAGATYEEIARAGGGIVSTVRADAVGELCRLGIEDTLALGPRLPLEAAASFH